MEVNTKENVAQTKVNNVISNHVGPQKLKAISKPSRLPTVDMAE